MIYFTHKAIKAGIREKGHGYNHYWLRLGQSAGLIPSPENLVKLHDKDNGTLREDMQIYTKSELEKIIEAYVEYASNMKKTTKNV